MMQGNSPHQIQRKNTHTMRKNTPTLNGTYHPAEVIAMLAVVFKPATLKEACNYLANRSMQDDMAGMPHAEIRDLWLMLDSAQTVQCGLPMRRHDPRELRANEMRSMARAMDRHAPKLDDADLFTAAGREYAIAEREYINTIPLEDR